ncbi:MAG: 2-oxoacid:ferredoxin oxidoreductase subunit beta, partial [Acidimicrobiia bacterium]
NVFNDKAFIQLTGKEERVSNRIDMSPGKPIVFGEGDSKAVVFRNGRCEIVDRASVSDSEILVHDPSNADPTIAFSLSRLAHGPYGPTPLGVFRNVERPVYEDQMSAQLVEAQAKRGPGDLGTLLTSQGTWEVN